MPRTGRLRERGHNVGGPRHAAELGVQRGQVGMVEHRRGQRFALVMDTAPCTGAEELAEGADRPTPTPEEKP